ncbi:MAG: hypothetical protein ACI8PT_003467 [Gammaproteobacteria bacterium]|jgi:hypothetical protein
MGLTLARPDYNHRKFFEPRLKKQALSRIRNASSPTPTDARKRRHVRILGASGRRPCVERTRTQAPMGCRAHRVQIPVHEIVNKIVKTYVSLCGRYRWGPFYLAFLFAYGALRRFVKDTER